MKVFVGGAGLIVFCEALDDAETLVRGQESGFVGEIVAVGMSMANSRVIVTRRLTPSSRTQHR